jgi:hypothetical protein
LKGFSSGGAATQDSAEAATGGEDVEDDTLEGASAGAPPASAKELGNTSSGPGGLGGDVDVDVSGLRLVSSKGPLPVSSALVAGTVESPAASSKAVETPVTAETAAGPVVTLPEVTETVSPIQTPAQFIDGSWEDILSLPPLDFHRVHGLSAKVLTAIQAAREVHIVEVADALCLAFANSQERFVLPLRGNHTAVLSNILKGSAGTVSLDNFLAEDGRLSSDQVVDLSDFNTPPMTALQANDYVVRERLHRKFSLVLQPPRSANGTQGSPALRPKYVLHLKCINLPLPTTGGIRMDWRKTLFRLQVSSSNSLIDMHVI